MRLFIAVCLNNEIIEELKRLQGQLRFAKLKPVKDFHLTLKFLGEVDESKINKINEKLEQVKYSCFKSSISEMGVFPKPDYARVVWIGVQKSDFIKLQALVDDKLTELGFNSDKRFHPHLTLARVKFVQDKVGFAKLITETKVNKLEFEVNDFRLIQSTLTSQGPIYKELTVFKLT